MTFYLFRMARQVRHLRGSVQSARKKELANRLANTVRLAEAAVAEGESPAAAQWWVQAMGEFNGLQDACERHFGGVMPQPFRRPVYHGHLVRLERDLRARTGQQKPGLNRRAGRRA